MRFLQLYDVLIALSDFKSQKLGDGLPEKSTTTATYRRGGHMGHLAS